MNREEIRRLLSMIATDDTNPDVFDFVLKRLVGLAYGAESERNSNEQSKNLSYNNFNLTKKERHTVSTINTLRTLIETGALGINPDTRVTLGFEYSEDVMHYNDDYQDEVFTNSDISTMFQEFLSTGVDKYMLDGMIKTAIENSDYIENEGYFIDDEGDEYGFEEACEKLGLVTDEDADEDENWSTVSSQMTFVPDDMTEAITYEYYDFGIDTSLEQYDYKRGCFTVSLDLETTAGALLETSYDFSGFRVTLDTSVASLTLK